MYSLWFYLGSIMDWADRSAARDDEYDLVCSSARIFGYMLPTERSQNGEKRVNVKALLLVQSPRQKGSIIA